MDDECMNQQAQTAWPSYQRLVTLIASKNFYISNKDAGTVVSILDDNTKPLGEIVMRPYDSKPTQLWCYVNNSIVSVANPTLVLDTQVDNRSMVTIPLHGGGNQVWFFSDDGSIVNGRGAYMTVSTDETYQGFKVIGAVKNVPLTADQIFNRVNL